MRTIYQKYLEYDPSNTAAWVRWAQLEAELGDLERARFLFDLGTTQELDMPEVLWKVRSLTNCSFASNSDLTACFDFLHQAWIDFEFSQQERERTRALYETLLSKTGHVKVWIAYALFEVQFMPAVDEEGDEIEGEGDGGDPELARAVLQRGYDALRAAGLKEERVVLLEAWKEFEANYGDDATQLKVEGMMPRVVKKWRKTDDGANAEECAYPILPLLLPSKTDDVHFSLTDWDMFFPDDERAANPQSFQLLQAAHAWKQQAALVGGSLLDMEDSDDDSDDSEDEDEAGAADEEGGESPKGASGDEQDAAMDDE